MTKVYKSPNKGKKYYVIHKWKKIHFWDDSYRIKPGTPAGNSYCARSWWIVWANDPTTPNYWARRLWWCEWKISHKSKTLETP